MPRASDIREEILDLYGQGIYGTEIARRLCVSHQTVYRHIASYKEGFDSLGAWQNYHARAKGFNSYHHYTLHLLKGKGFRSFHKYAISMAEEKGFKSYRGYRDFLAMQKGEGSWREQAHNQYMEKRGITSRKSRRYTKRERGQRKKQSKRLSRMIRKGLKKLGRSQSWLAKKAGVTRQAISLYTTERQTPSPDTAREICKVLDLRGRGIEILFE